MLIDSIAVTNGILEYVEGCKLLGNNKIVYSNHRAYVVDIVIEEYFLE